MKLSIAWIFDHIQADWRTVDIPKLVHRFNEVTAEIDGFEKVALDLSTFSCAQVIDASAQGVTLNSPEWQTEVTLPARTDVQKGRWFVIKKNGTKFSWATPIDWHTDKDGLLPALNVTEQEAAGAWKTNFEAEDYILELDNKSVTNRADMWGHRGFAREVAAILDLQLKPLDEFVAQATINETSQVAATPDHPITVSVESTDVVHRFATAHLANVTAQSSSPWMAYRLLKVGTRAINLLVDATNYVMLDIGQPMHVFDADAIRDKKLIVRKAQNAEKLVLLDEQEIELTTDDVVIADGQGAISLAGIMGGLYSGVTPKTKNVLLESANFDATTIRRSAERYKVRTEASARFEKSLDPNQNTDAIIRFVQLLTDENASFEFAGTLNSIGERAKELTIVVSHDFIERRLGVTIADGFVQKALGSIGFSVSAHPEPVEGDDQYHVTVPTFRSTKDVTIKEDIVEEVGRLFGYTSIVPVLPTQQQQPIDLQPVMRVREIKKSMAYGLNMHEASNYPLYDEDFLRELQWQPTHPAALRNPLSENWKVMVTSLIPHLIKNVQQNAVEADELDLFEWGRIWEQKDTNAIDEQRALAGIMFDKKNNVDFYAAKNKLEQFFHMLHMPVSWVKVSNPEEPWFVPYQTADLMLDGVCIGRAGKVNSILFSRVVEGDAFVFELDGDALLQHCVPTPVFEALPKYPDVHRDVSMMVPLKITVDQVKENIVSRDDRIFSVELVDCFQKPEWEYQKSLTMRFGLRDREKTLTKEEVDTVFDDVVKVLTKIGAAIR